MRIYNKSFEFSGFVFGLIAMAGFFGFIRSYWSGAEPSWIVTAMGCGVSLLFAAACSGWSLFIGSRLRQIREWRLPEGGGEDQGC